MTNDKKYVCGHPKSSHNPSFAPWHCASTDCPCSGFRPAEEEKTASVYERARTATRFVWGETKALLEVAALGEITVALDAGEAAEKRAETAENRAASAEAKIAAMHEAVKEAELRPPDEWGVFVIKSPDGTDHVASPTQAQGFYRAIKKQWESDWVGKLSNRYIDLRRRAESAERERDELKADLAEVVQSAERDNPKALRRRIAELEDVLAKANAAAERIDKKLDRVIRRISDE